MAITAREIDEKSFRKSLSGYKVEEVDDYLDDVADEMERLEKENEALKAQVATHQEKEKRIAEMEQTLRDTLITAQRAAEDVLKASREKTAAMSKDSELEGRRILEDAELQAQEAVRRLEGIRRDVAGVKALIRRVIGEQLRLLEESYPDEQEAEPEAPAAHRAADQVISGADFDQTQEFSAREVRELAGWDERLVFPNLRETVRE